MSKEGALIINNLLLIAATLTVFLGTFYPLMVEAFTKEKISVGAPFFDMTFAPIMCLLIFFMAFGPLLKWRADSLRTHTPTIRKGFAILVLTAILFGLFGKSVLGGLSLGLAALLAFGTFATLAKKIRWRDVSLAESWTLLRAQPAATFGFIGSHLGIAIFAAGVTSMSVWSASKAEVVNIGETISIGSYDYTLKDMAPGTRENYQFFGGNTIISKNGKAMAEVYSERRYYPVRDMVTTESGLHLSLTDTLFASVGAGDPEKGWEMRVYYHPFVAWIWIGAVMIALSGFISLLDRRVRIKRDTLSLPELSEADA